MAVGGKKGVKSDINVTPLVDVVLVLLIIFMVVTPMLQRGKSVELPKAGKDESKENTKDPIVLSVTAAKEMWVESTKVDDHTKLQEVLRQEHTAKPVAPILLKGDSTLKVEDVRKVMDTARKAGFKGINLAVEEKR